MASTSTSTISDVIVSAMLTERIRSNINRRCVLLNLLRHEICGDPLSWTVKFRGRTVPTAGVAQTAAAPTTSQDTPVKATLNIGEYADTASVTGRAESAAAMALNPLGVSGGTSLMMGEIKDAVGNIAEGIANEIYSGTGSDSIIGLATAVDSTGTYANIDPSTYTDWVSIEDTGALADISFEMIREFLTDIEDLGGERPDFAVTTPTVLDKVKGLFSGYDPYVNKVNIGGRDVMLSGARAVNVEGIWLVGDPRCTAGTIYALNSEHISLRSMPHAGFTLPGMSPDVVAAEFARVTGQTITAQEAASLLQRALNGGLIPFVKDLGASGNQTSKEVFCYPQLQVKERFKHGKLVLS